MTAYLICGIFSMLPLAQICDIFRFSMASSKLNFPSVSAPSPNPQNDAQLDGNQKNDGRIALNKTKQR